jgi:hypothetical protein
MCGAPCREAPVSQGIYRLYQPQAAVQIDPNAPGRELRATTNPVPTAAPTAGPTSRPTPGSTPNRTPEPLPTVPVTVAENAIVWAAPYSGIVLAAPGTIVDVETQRLLSDYLNSGGRLFLNGQDILFALTGAGTIDNAFARDELKAAWTGSGFGGETAANDVFTNGYGFEIRGSGQGGDRISNRTPLRFFNVPADPPNTLHVPFNSAGNPPDNTYFDASDNDTFGDILGTVDGGPAATVTELYSYGGRGSAARAAQLVERRNRANGLESRLVFFGFGLEHINREWTNAENLSPCRNYRGKLAENIANDLRTGRVTGRVIDTSGNPIPNFLMQITDPGFTQRFFMVRTDANGFYEFVGVPSRDDFYRVSPASQVLRSGRIISLNAGYFTNQNIFTRIDVLGGQVRDEVNFRINPAPPSAVVGRAISDRGTPSNTGDDENPTVDVAPNVPVLLRSLDSLPPSEQAPTGGFYAQLTQTDASGEFSFNNVPGDVRIEIVFNPLPGFVSRGGDIPDGSGINYNTPTSQIQRNPNFGRRVIPDDRTYNGPRIPSVPGTGDLVIPTGMTVDLGDVPIPPAGSDISGRVFRVLNGQRVGVSGATVQLLSGGGVVRTVTTNTQGLYTLGDIQPGSYTVVATLVVGQSTLRGSVTVSVARATNAIAPDILLGTSTPGGTPTPSPTGGPGATPTPTPTTAPQDETYQPGQTYMISVPFADSSAATATTTVARAFTALPRVGTVANYRLTRYDAARGVYVELTAASLIRRGEGYFLTPLARGVSLRRPPADRTRIPLAGTQFTITLRRVVSAGQNLPNGTSNGYNLIGFPFNPAGFTSINWLESRVISPVDGRTMTLQQAVGAGLIDPNLLTLQDGTRNYVRTQTMVPFRGYFARAFRDNVRVILFARR